MIRIKVAGRVAVIAVALLGSGVAFAGGEAGQISLRDQGFFWVGKRVSKVEAPAAGGAPARTATSIEGQMYVGYQLPARKRHPYPLVLVHGGGGQATDWMGTPDGRDGLVDYFLAAGFDVYFVDRPAHGRSPNNKSYGDLRASATTQQISGLAQSKQYPGGGGADTKEVIEHTSSSEPGPTVSNAIIKENFTELLDRIGPVIFVTASAGGPSGWLAMDARPDLVKAVAGLEPAMGITSNLAPLITFLPALAAGERVETEAQATGARGGNSCPAQPADKVRTVPAYKGKKVLLVEAPMSPFTGNYLSCEAALRQLGADAKLARLVDSGLEGNGHFMNEEMNVGEIAKKVLIPWLSSIK